MKSLYITYDGISDPIGQSQVLPYIKKLTKEIDFYLISFEKTNKSNFNFIDKFKYVKLLRFYNNKFAKFYEIIKSIYYIRKIIKKYNIDVIHLRGFVPALIFFFTFSKKKFIYDFRSFAVEEYIDIGKLKKNSFIYKIFRAIDTFLIKKSSAIIVLEPYAKSLLFKHYNYYHPNVYIINTSTDTKKYNVKKHINKSGKFKFVSLGGAINPYDSKKILKVIMDLNSMGIDSSIDFINKFDHEYIKQISNNLNFPKAKLKIYSLPHNEISIALNKFDFGFIFIKTSEFRRVCSPTKLGELMSSGIPILGLKGIDVLDEFEKKYSFIINLDPEKIFSKNKEYTQFLIKFIQKHHDPIKIRDAALKNFDLEKACLKYKKLYQSI